ncbi:MAG: glycerol-3-phosphate 1-O-acyltransferase PlsY [Candidatus Omnitrophota bacterium]
MLFLVSLISAYLIGSIPTSYLFGKILKGIDIRQFGSGNVGATNTYRVMGKLPGIAVLIIDVVKGLICVTLLARLFLSLGVSMDPKTYSLMLGLASIVGHDWTIFLKFKGGKGVATSTGVFMGISPQVFMLGLIVWMAVFFWKRYVSLASIVAAVTVPVLFSILMYPLAYVIFSALICVITVIKHYPNIQRLARGEEHKIYPVRNSDNQRGEFSKE